MSTPTTSDSISIAPKPRLHTTRRVGSLPNRVKLFTAPPMPTGRRAPRPRALAHPNRPVPRPFGAPVSCTPGAGTFLSAASGAPTSGEDRSGAEQAATNDEPDDFRQLRDTGDRALRDRLLEEHQWIVAHCARRFADRGEPLEDLMQVGQIGLFKALERFDPDYGASFTTFAVPTVLGEIRRHFRDATWAVRVPRRLKDLHVEIGPATEHLVARLGRTPKLEELASYLQISVDEALEAIEAGSGYRSTPLTNDGSDSSEPHRDLPELQVVDKRLGTAEDRVFVERLLATLPERERKIVTLRFYGELSQREIAEIVGVSQVHVSRLLRSALVSLQAAASSRRTLDPELADPELGDQVEPDVAS